MRECEEEWKELCRQAAVEQDSSRLVELTRRINELLRNKPAQARCGASSQTSSFWTVNMSNQCPEHARLQARTQPTNPSAQLQGRSSIHRRALSFSLDSLIRPETGLRSKALLVCGNTLSRCFQFPNFQAGKSTRPWCIRRSP